MTVRLVLASNNKGKVRELRDILVDQPLLLVTPSEIGISLDINEDGATYEENARLKALAMATKSNMVALADDSGLEVDALGGEPGLHSARYAGKDASDIDRVTLLLKKLEGVPFEKRTAKFRCVIVIATPDGRTGACEGTCSGVISFEPRGSQGFGYDPVFYFPDLGMTMAELPSDIKNQVSHRGKAARQVPFLLKKLGITG